MSLKTFICAAVVACAPAVVSAATALNIGGFYSGGEPALATGNSVEFEFVAAEDLRVEDFIAITGNGGNAGNDLAKVQYGYEGVPVVDVMAYFSSITVTGQTATATATLDGFVMTAGQTFKVKFAYDAGGTFPVDVDFSFVTAAVPLPAGGLLLLTGLGGLAFARRRKQKA